MKLSIVIPVYNVEQYLNKCLMSVLVQDTAMYEIILIDDGSTDNSGSICDDYALKYDNVKIIHQKNGGLSNARNNGISHSCGEYVMFLDSDDYLEEGCISEFETIIAKHPCDIIVGDSKIIDDEGNSKYHQHYLISEQEYSIEEYLVFLKSKHCYTACAPYSIYNKNFLEREGLSFKENILHEDELWMPSVLLKAKSVYYSGILFYYHFVRANSITQDSNMEQKGRMLLYICEELQSLFDQSNIKPINALKDQIAVLYLKAICQVKDYTSLLIRYDKSIPINNAYYIRTKAKSFLFNYSPKLYIMTHTIKVTMVNIYIRTMTLINRKVPKWI